MLTTDPGEGQEVDMDQIVTKQGIVYPLPQKFRPAIQWTQSSRVPSNNYFFIANYGDDPAFQKNRVKSFSLALDQSCLYLAHIRNLEEQYEQLLLKQVIVKIQLLICRSHLQLHY